MANKCKNDGVGGGGGTRDFFFAGIRMVSTLLLSH